MRVIIDEIDRVTRTIRQLLDFSRFKPALVRSCAVDPAVRAVVELLRFEADRRKVTLTVSIPGPVPPVAADPDQLQQVLVNLTMNACDAADAGGHVEIGAVVEGARARLEVVDDGCGIPPEHRHQVFDPFFTTKKRGQGTGLGLAVTAQIVRNHGGEIELASEIGAGTRVTVHWPLAASVAVTTEHHEVHGNSAST
jgi:signal transduction histidine kinase